jgi:hypothetical protein
MLDGLVYTFLQSREPARNTELEYELPPKPKPSGAASGHASLLEINPHAHIPGSHPVVIRAAAIGKAIAAVLQKQNDAHPLFLVLHNIDGPGFANKVYQAALGTLLVNSSINGLRYIKLVASVYHVDAATTLWNTYTTALFSFVSTIRCLCTLWCGDSLLYRNAVLNLAFAFDVPCSACTRM